MEGRESIAGSESGASESSPGSCGGNGPLPQAVSMEMSMSMERTFGGGGNEMMMMMMMGKKKRGRPRKYGPDGNMALALSPAFSSPPSSSEFSPKRGRGRPPGSGKRQLLAALGEWVAGSAGGNFTPHVVTIAAGEDVATKILSFSQKGPRAICILSANGAISNVTLRQPGSSGGTLTYEGRFEILSLSGSFTLTDNGGIRSRTGGISVSLAGPDGRVVGGGVAGLLLAASPIQVVVGSFMPNSHKEQKRRPNPESSILTGVPTTSGIVTAARPISQATPDEDTCATPSSTLPGQSHGDVENSTGNNLNQASTSFHTVGWHGGSQSTSDHRPSPDINIRLPGE
ncbi:AT-hook motif nuclear-localized protein 10-like [Magnolia sinica]|uniref:AT-hook motif nuclear-localized protein 10-like n=1 Tax=Magnolia sinica TaxID=86752 RepID=UPI002659BBF7|nr:AT-hook motif nuclear-localized protein 10-like [Magnolia sinica]XP_058108733.1 AT-hook motif nuclear-localized protein 10-like [Magnolia sinica]